MGYRDVFGYGPVYSAYPGFLGLGAKVAKDVKAEWKTYIDELQALNQQLRKGSVAPDTPEPLPPETQGTNAQEKKARDILQAIVNARQIARNLAAAAYARSETSVYVRGGVPGYVDPAPVYIAQEPGVFVDATVPDAAAPVAPGVPSPVTIPGTQLAPVVQVNVPGMPAGAVQDIAPAGFMDPEDPAILEAGPGGMGKWIIGGVLVAGIAAILLLRRKKRKNPGRRRSARRRRR